MSKTISMNILIKTFKAEAQRQREAADKATIDSNRRLPKQIQVAVTQLLAIDFDNLKARRDVRVAIENMGNDLEGMTVQRSLIWDQVILSLARRANKENPMDQIVTELKSWLQALMPQTRDLEMGLFRRLLSKHLMINAPTRKYFTQYEQFQPALAKMLDDLDSYKNQVRRDNIILEDEQQLMAGLEQHQNEILAYAEAVVEGLLQGLTEWKKKPNPAKDAQLGFIETELLYALQQKVVELQQQSVITRQGIHSLEMIRRDNQKMIRGISHLLTVTLGAWQTAMTSALVLTGQPMTFGQSESLANSGHPFMEPMKSTEGIEQDPIECLKRSFLEIKVVLNGLS